MTCWKQTVAEDVCEPCFPDPHLFSPFSQGGSGIRPCPRDQIGVDADTFQGLEVQGHVQERRASQVRTRGRDMRKRLENRRETFRGRKLVGVFFAHWKRKEAIFHARVMSGTTHTRRLMFPRHLAFAGSICWGANRHSNAGQTWLAPSSPCTASEHVVVYPMSETCITGPISFLFRHI